MVVMWECWGRVAGSVSAEQPPEVRERPSLLNSGAASASEAEACHKRGSVQLQRRLGCLLRHRYSSVTSVSSHLRPVFCLLWIIIIDLRWIEMSKYNYPPRWTFIQTGDVNISRQASNGVRCFVVELKWSDSEFKNLSIWFWVCG